MRKHLAITAVIVSAVLTLSGCFPTGEKDPNISADLSGRGLFEYSKDNLTVSFEIPEIPDNLPTRIKLKGKTFDTDEMLELFLGGKTILEEETWCGNYYTDDDSHIGITSNSIGFYEGDMAPHTKFQIEAPLNYQAAILVSKEYFRDVYGIGKELEGFSSRSAADRAMELISTLGITGLGEPEIYAYSIPVLEKLKERDFTFAFNEKYPLTKDNEVYVLRCKQLFEGIELANTDVSVKVNTDEIDSFLIDASEITVGVSKDKIFYFTAYSVYQSEYEIINSAPAKYDLNYALNELTSYLDKSFFSTETVINKAKPVYFPVERNAPGYTEYALAWYFEGIATKKMKEGDTVYHSIEAYKLFVSAETGIISKSR